MTPERLERITKMLQHRQPDLTVCMESVHKPHNLAAVVRTCDAVGVNNVHAVWSIRPTKVSGGTATGSQNWVKVHSHDNIAAAIKELKAQGMQVLATNLSDTAVDFRDIDYTKPTAILMGQEKTGISAEALALADQDIIIPMVGMVQSLNVSVATATILYEAQRQRDNAGMYQGESKLPAEEQHKIFFEGGHPVYAKACKRKGLTYPELDAEGQIVADESWWDALRSSK
ncbi:tRNA (guanosine(18)-2'-O)-methyltransferase TrmH [Moritella sp.]|uniref:tRNA (guanosine(18)-2'-O)-methyltransferase TrmH n=1 Tax=Moritella sp. TaxID=78556 RepID=UPI001D8B6CA8|nr:tRNA (guanosine(18)-2'-O)-methyltransferase TrmH [Moritella sp.]MCJ8350699.1 tRNA (guanosine(18)-2'-O)-methyltransferase TrmH [Moritella sp.]NQZ41039.1 tRNA (guanosine(18)-2'-O)-methyltransferase TrmH [Moritella sp.]